MFTSVCGRVEHIDWEWDRNKVIMNMDIRIIRYMA